MHRGDTTGALTELNQIRRQVWYKVTLRSTFYSQTFERFTRTELLGDEDQALEHYARFVELRKDADPELPAAGGGRTGSGWRGSPANRRNPRSDHRPMSDLPGCRYRGC